MADAQNVIAVMERLEGQLMKITETAKYMIKHIAALPEAEQAGEVLFAAQQYPGAPAR